MKTHSVSLLHIELSRRLESSSANTTTSEAKPSRTVRINAKIRLGAETTPISYDDFLIGLG